MTFEPLLNEAFLIYHCGHQVHTRAAILEEISICRDPARKVRLEDVKQERDQRTISLVTVLVLANFEYSALAGRGRVGPSIGLGRPAEAWFSPWNSEKSIEKMEKFEPGIKGNEKIGADLKARTKKLVTETSKYDSYFMIHIF